MEIVNPLKGGIVQVCEEEMEKNCFKILI